MSDLISREAAVERFCKLGEYLNEKYATSGDPYIMAALFLQNKEEFPSVEQKGENYET